MNSLIKRAEMRINSDRADSNTTSNILWIAMTVVLVIAVASMIGRAVMKKGDDVATQINNSQDKFGDFVTEGNQNESLRPDK